MSQIVIRKGTSVGRAIMPGNKTRKQRRVHMTNGDRKTDSIHTLQSHPTFKLRILRIMLYFPYFEP